MTAHELQMKKLEFHSKLKENDHKAEKDIKQSTCRRELFVINDPLTNLHSRKIEIYE